MSLLGKTGNFMAGVIGAGTGLQGPMRTAGGAMGMSAMGTAMGLGRTAWGAGKGAGKGAMIGAGVGAGWGAVSDDTSMIGGAMMGAAAGAGIGRYGGRGARAYARQKAKGATGGEALRRGIVSAGRGVRKDVRGAGMAGGNWLGGSSGAKLTKAVNPISSRKAGKTGSGAADNVWGRVQQKEGYGMVESIPASRNKAVNEASTGLSQRAAARQPGYGSLGPEAAIPERLAAQRTQGERFRNMARTQTSSGRRAASSRARAEAQAGTSSLLSAAGASQRAQMAPIAAPMAGNSTLSSARGFGY